MFDIQISLLGCDEKIPEDLKLKKEEYSSSDSNIGYVPYKPATVSKTYYIAEFGGKKNSKNWLKFKYFLFLIFEIS